jgi:hypothetical protein
VERSRVESVENRSAKLRGIAMQEDAVQLIDQGRDRRNLNGSKWPLSLWLIIIIIIIIIIIVVVVVIIIITSY